MKTDSKNGRPKKAAFFVFPGSAEADLYCTVLFRGAVFPFTVKNENAAKARKRKSEGEKHRRGKGQQEEQNAANQPRCGKAERTARKKKNKGFKERPVSLFKKEIPGHEQKRKQKNQEEANADRAAEKRRSRFERKIDFSRRKSCGKKQSEKAGWQGGFFEAASECGKVAGKCPHLFSVVKLAANAEERRPRGKQSEKRQRR